MHVRAALRNGLTRDEIKEILLQTAVYCGVPAANSRLRDRPGRARRGGRRRDARRAALGRAHADRPPRRRALAGAPRRPRGDRDRGRGRARRAWIPSEIEDVYFGCANQAGEDNRNVARMAALLAGLPQSVAGVTSTASAPRGSRRSSAACHAVRRGRRRPLRRRRRGVDEPRAARDRQARPRLPARRPHALRHDARLALPEPAPWRRCSRSRAWARPARTWPSATA